MSVIQPKGKPVYRMTIDVDSNGLITMDAKTLTHGLIGQPQGIQPIQVVGFLLKLASEMMQQMLAGRAFINEKQKTDQESGDGIRPA